MTGLKPVDDHFKVLNLIIIEDNAPFIYFFIGLNGPFSQKREADLKLDYKFRRFQFDVCMKTIDSVDLRTTI